MNFRTHHAANEKGIRVSKPSHAVKSLQRFGVAGLAHSDAFRGSSVRLAGRRLPLLVLIAVAFLFIPASQAVADVIVNLAGSGTGTVSSAETGNGGHKIECSNVGGVPAGPFCSEEYPSFTPDFSAFFRVNLTPVPNSDSYFAGWAGDDFLAGEEGAPTCNSGKAEPCAAHDASELFGEPTLTHVTATFKKLADRPPVVSTGGTSDGPNELLTRLEGTVNPEGADVEDCRFEYGPSTKYGFQAPCVPSGPELGFGTTPEPVHGEAELELLKPSTTYHYRVVASNLAGTAKGDDKTFTTKPAPPDHCLINAQIRDTQVFGAILLPQCMALEMVSPPEKGSQNAVDPVVSAEGKRVIFSSTASLDGTPGGVSPGIEPYVATRGSSEWTTASTTAPVDIVGGWDGYGTALSYTPDFSRWFHIASTSAQFRLGISRAFQGGLGGIFTPISPVFGPLGGGILSDVNRIKFQGASADHTHLYFVPDQVRTAYLAGDPEPSGGAADHNTYVARLDVGGKPSLELLARDDAGKVWGGSCGARLGGIRRTSFSEPTGERNQGAVSADGSRVYFSTRPTEPNAAPACNAENKLRILERQENPQGPWIGELFSSECGRATPACSGADGNDYYQGASSDGTKVYFTTNRQLASSDVDTTNEECSNVVAAEGCDLYLYDSTLPVGHRLIQVSAGGAGDPTPGMGAKVLNGTTAISGDGSHVYFVAQGVLTNAENPEHAVAQAGQPNLYVWDRTTEATAFIGTLNPGDAGTLWGGDGILAVPELGDGHALPFVSKAALTADDLDGTHRDLFLYNADSEELVRISKAAPGGVDNGAFDVQESNVNRTSLGTDFAEQLRHVDESGGTLIFTSAEGLVPGDANGTTDGYMWRQGALYRLPGVAASDSGGVSSHDGSTIAFETKTALLPQDGDTARDVYVVREDGGYPLETAERCQPDENLAGKPCQEAQPSPSLPSVGSGNPPDPGNVQPKPSCRKNQVRHHGRCVKPSKRKRHQHKRNANANRRAGK